MYYDTIIIMINTWKVSWTWNNIKQSVHLHSIMQNYRFVQRRPSGSVSQLDRFPSLELLHCVSLDGWLGGDKTSSLCFMSISKGTIANPTSNLFRVSNSTIFIDRNWNTSTLRFARSVLSLTTEYSSVTSVVSVAIFTAWCLALVHVLVHARLSTHGVAGRDLSIYTIYVLIAYRSA